MLLSISLLSSTRNLLLMHMIMSMINLRINILLICWLSFNLGNYSVFIFIYLGKSKTE